MPFYFSMSIMDDLGEIEFMQESDFNLYNILPRFSGIHF